MISTLPRASAEFIRDCGTGEFRLSLRNRPIGRESVLATPEPGGGLNLRAGTALEAGGFRLRQEVLAGFDCSLCPEWCIVTVDLHSRQMRLEIEFDRNRATANYRCDGQESSWPIPLDHPPLLLVDNCFSLHALAAAVAFRLRGSEAVFVSVPAGADLTVTAPGVAPVLMGGRDFGPPTLTLHLAPDLQEHAWIRGDRAERLVVPQAQMCVDWIGKEGGERS